MHIDLYLHTLSGQRLPVTARQPPSLPASCIQVLASHLPSLSFSTTAATFSLVSDAQNSSPFAALFSSTGRMAKINPIRFSTKWWDDETGLGWWGYRWYGESRWLSRDPLGERSDLNLYSAMRNRFIWTLDPLGLTIYEIYFDPTVEHGTVEANPNPEPLLGRQLAASRDEEQGGDIRSNASWGSVFIDWSANGMVVTAVAEGWTDFTERPLFTEHLALSATVKGPVLFKGCCASRTALIRWSVYVDASPNPSGGFPGQTPTSWAQVGSGPPLVSKGGPLSASGEFQVGVFPDAYSAFDVYVQTVWGDYGELAGPYGGKASANVVVSCVGE